MGRKKATMALIPNHSIRKSTFRNRKASLIKKARELSLLCGQPVYLEVSDGPDGSSPEVWPPTEAAAAARALFHAATSQDKDMEKLEQELTTMQAQLKHLDTENLNLEAEQRLMTALPVGPYRLVEVDSSDLAARIQDILGRRMKEIQDRMDTLLAAQKPLSVAPDVEFSTKFADAGMVQPTPTTSESEDDGSYMAPILHLEESMQIDYGDIAISFDPSSGDFMQQHNMQKDTHTPGSINVAASSSAWCGMSSGVSADLAPVPGIPVEDSMDEEIAAILYPSQDDSMDEEVAAIFF